MITSKKQIEALQSYAMYLSRLERRLDVIDFAVSKYHRGSSATGITAIDFDFCFIQFRFVAELLAYGLVELHKAFGFDIPNKVAFDEDKASRIVPKLVRANIFFYPLCISARRKEETVSFTVVSPQPLSSADFIKAINKIYSTSLHASSEPLLATTDLRNFEFIEEHCLLLRKQLSHHLIRLRRKDSDLLVRGKIGVDSVVDVVDGDRISGEIYDSR